MYTGESLKTICSNINPRLTCNLWKTDGNTTTKSNNIRTSVKPFILKLLRALSSPVFGFFIDNNLSLREYTSSIIYINDGTFLPSSRCRLPYCLFLSLRWEFPLDFWFIAKAVITVCKPYEEFSCTSSLRCMYIIAQIKY